MKTTALLAALTAFLVLIGHFLGGQQGMVLAFILAIGMNFFSYWYSDKIILRRYNAHEITPNQAPEIYDIVHNLTQRADLPMPRIFIIPEQTPNAFATGRDPEHAIVAITEGLLNILDRDEIAGVLAHELAHVKNRDILIGSIAATLAGAIMIIANMARWFAFFGGMDRDDDEGSGGIFGVLLMSFLAPIAAMLIQMAISRSREYLADSTGSRFAGNSRGLANALEKLNTYSIRRPLRANPSTAHMFIVNPLSGQSLASLFSTHPPIEERISRLRGNDKNTTYSRDTEDRMTKAGRDFWDQLS